MSQDVFEDVWSADRSRQTAAYEVLMADPPAPDSPMWDEVVTRLGDRDNHHRSVAGQLLCAMAANDPGGRVWDAFDALWAVTFDPRFVTARHTIRSLWRIGLASPEQRGVLLGKIADRYRAAEQEKNTTLVRSDLIAGLRKLHDETGDPRVEELAGELIELEPDLKYRRKYRTHWR